jgi:cation diffusion facilitator CzcD-associated flavoprotein CzcO
MSTPIPRAVTALPVVVIGAGPVGLVAAAHLQRARAPRQVLEAGAEVGAAMREWGHVRTFTPWQYVVDPTAEKLLAPLGWRRPDSALRPTGGQIVAEYLQPLAAALGADVVRTGSRVVAVSRQGLDKSRTLDREKHPFVVRVQSTDGSVREILARAVIDASGTWEPAEPARLLRTARCRRVRGPRPGLLVGALPDVLGRDRKRYAGRRTLVVGMGHSAANTLLDLARLAGRCRAPRCSGRCAAPTYAGLWGGATADELPARGRLGTELRSLVEAGAVQHVTGLRHHGRDRRRRRFDGDGRGADRCGSARARRGAHRRHRDRLPP